MDVVTIVNRFFGEKTVASPVMLAVQTAVGQPDPVQIVYLVTGVINVIIYVKVNTVHIVDCRMEHVRNVKMDTGEVLVNIDAM